LPAKLCSSTPSFFASASAPSFILAKNGLVLVLVMRPTITLSAALAGAVHKVAAKAAIAALAMKIFKRDAECPRASARSTIMSSSQYWSSPRRRAGLSAHALGMTVVGFSVPFCLLSSRTLPIYV
jgi:hypothetical protein